ncbi:hypothetical protein KO465_09375 [Candidatus Micrarchaeota archaeon]|nr:hypothetical protein [Candidatus Micrarchaeota archaeon]
MKRLFALTLVFIMFLALAGCGGKSDTAQNKPDDSGQTEPQQTVTDQTSAPEKASDGEGIICVSYEAYDSAWHAFSDYIVEQSGDHEIVAVHQSTAMPLELKNLNYLLPLSFLGQSQQSLGKFDAAMEAGMLEVWADDVSLTYDEMGGYLLKGTDTGGSALEIKTRYDGQADSLRLEGYQDGNLDMVFEYSKTPDGYAAQYYYETIIGNDKFTPIYGLCTYRIIITGSNGSCARFDNVSSEPASIFGHVPDEKTFIEGAAHWFTITNGEFAGKLGGKEF